MIIGESDIYYTKHVERKKKSFTFLLLLKFSLLCCMTTRTPSSAKANASTTQTRTSVQMGLRHGNFTHTVCQARVCRRQIGALGLQQKELLRVLFAVSN